MAAFASGCRIDWNLYTSGINWFLAETRMENTFSSRFAGPIVLLFFYSNCLVFGKVILLDDCQVKPVIIELFGIVRQRAGVSRIEIPVEQTKQLGDLLEELVQRYPDMHNACIDGCQLQPGFVVNLGGQRFTTDPTEKIQPGDTVLVMSADAGG